MQIWRFSPINICSVVFDPPALGFLWRLLLPVVREYQQQQGSRWWFPLCEWAVVGRVKLLLRVEVNDRMMGKGLDPLVK